MKTKIFDNWDFYSCYIDRDEFYDLVKKWDLKIEKEYPNKNVKEASWVHYNLMNSEKDWIIEVSKAASMWENWKYAVRCNFWRFPAEIVTIWHKKILAWWRIRYWWIYAWDIDWSEYWWSSSMYTKDKNWPRRKMIEDNGFKIKEING